MTLGATESRTNKALWMLLFGNFIIGTGVLLPAGLLNQLATELHVDVATTGLLLLAGGIVVGVGAPLLATLTTRVDRKVLLMCAMGLYGAGHLASAFTSSFWTLLIIRMLMISAAGIFSPQAAATVSLMVPPERRASAIAFIFIGWSVASVAGIPLASFIGSALGWHMVFLIMSGLSVLSGLAVWVTVPRALYGSPLNFLSWKTVFTSPALMAVLGVTLLSFSGQFVVFGYLAPVLKDVAAASPAGISVAFAIVGVAGIAGNAIATRMVRNLPVHLVIGMSLASLCLGYFVFALLFGNYWGGMTGLALWGFGTFSSNSLQQSRLVQLAPVLASATVALNTSAVYLGQAIGSGVGGFLITGGASVIMAWTGLAFLLLSLAASLMATRLKV